MSNDLTISIAEQRVCLLLDQCDAPTRARLTAYYAAFIVDESSAPISIRLTVEPGPPFIPLHSASVWQIRTAAQNGRIEFESFYERGWVDRAAGQGMLVMRAQGDPENFLRVLYAWLCLDQHALLIHACGVIRNGRAYVFFGASGSGKTTIARLSSDHTVLSDDLVIIEQDGARIRAYGVPFRGDLPEAPRTNAAAELEGLFILVKDTKHHIEPVSVPEAIARLAACVPFVVADSAQARRVMDLCTQIESTIAVRALHFRRDADFWRIIDGLEPVPDADGASRSAHR